MRLGYIVLVVSKFGTFLKLFECCVHKQPILLFIVIIRGLNGNVLSSVGVLFTRHPVTSNPGVMVINANYGLGEVSETLNTFAANFQSNKLFFTREVI